MPIHVVGPGKPSTIRLDEESEWWAKQVLVPDFESLTLTIQPSRHPQPTVAPGWVGKFFAYCP